MKSKKNTKELPNTRVKLTFRRHFLPPLAGLFVALLVFGFFNSGLLSGKIAYYIYSRQTIVPNLDAQTTKRVIDKQAPPKIIINKLNVTAPVIYDVDTVDQTIFQQALQKGVVHYPKTALPGEPGNVVIFGHSSGQWWAPGDFKFVFTLLDKLQIEDRIFLEYQGIRYIYKVNDISIVEPTNLSVLNQTNNHTLTLITCSPVGSNAKRLIIKAQQIAPKATSPDTNTTPMNVNTETIKELPSSPPSFWDNFKELFN